MGTRFSKTRTLHMRNSRVNDGVVLVALLKLPDLILIPGEMVAYISRTQHLVLITWLAFFAAFALVGFRDFLTNVEENRCDMTWMYEWPRYIRVPLWKGTVKRFPKYALYLYAEGEYADKSRDLSVSGIPVLFIPGNAGSYKQVRSLASVALRKAENLRSRIHFNYFTADLDEAFSGLFGGILAEQTEFIKLCVTRILWLYKNVANPPSSVVVIGHSMGGLIARGLFTVPKFDPSLVHTILTFGTPHHHPVMYLDPRMMEYYERVNNFWRKRGLTNQSKSELMNVNVVSVGGGMRDLLVRSSLASMNPLAESSNTVSVVTTAIPRVWLSVDHLCLCWCRQLVLVTNRALFDLIDTKNKQIMEDKEERMKILSHYFIKNSGLSRVKLVTGNSGKHLDGLAKDVNPVVLHKRLWRFKGRSATVGEQKVFAFPIDEWSTTHDSLIILAGIDSDDWLYGCHSQACNTVTDLSSLAELLPWNRSVIKYAKLELKYFTGMSFFAIRVPSSASNIILWSEYYSSRNSLHEVELPGLLSKETVVLDITSDSLFFNLSFKSCVKNWNVYVFNIKSIDCGFHKSSLTGRIRVPWFNEDVYSFSNNGSIQLVLKLNHPKPKENKGNIQLHLWLDPKCSHRVTVQYDFYQMLGQIFRYYSIQLVCWTFCIVMLVFTWQLSSMASEQKCGSFFSLVANISRSLRVLLVVLQSHFFISQFVLAYLVFIGADGQQNWLPNIDDLKTFTWLLPLILIISTAVIIVILLFVWLDMFVRFTSFLLTCFTAFSHIQFGFGMKDVICGVVVVATSILLCGTLSLILIFILCLWRTLKYMAALQAYKNQPTKQKSKSLLILLESLGSFNLTLCVLLMLLISVNLPALAVWTKNIDFSFRLSSDHTSWLSIIIGLNILTFDPQVTIPHFLVYFCFLLSIAVTQSPIVPLYAIPYVICLLFTMLNVFQFIGRLKTKRHKEE